MEKPKYGYKVYYSGQSVDIYAESLWAARDLGAIYFKVKKNKQHMITAILCEKEGEQITHKTSDL